MLLGVRPHQIRIGDPDEVAVLGVDPGQRRVDERPAPSLALQLAAQLATARLASAPATRPSAPSSFAAGWRVLELTYDDVVGRPDAVASAITAGAAVTVSA